jgi:hypothetical protein
MSAASNLIALAVVVSAAAFSVAVLKAKLAVKADSFRRVTLREPPLEERRRLRRAGHRQCSIIDSQRIRRQLQLSARSCRPWRRFERPFKA